MGLKKLIEKYNIKHLVQKRNDNICIGSEYIPDIIVISFEGKLIKKYKNGDYDDGWSINEDLKRYQEELLIDEENGELKKIIDLNDSYDVLLPIYTYDKDVLIETYCEKYGYPNITIDGYLIYDNEFFKTKEDAVKYGKKICDEYIKLYNNELSQYEEKIINIKNKLEEKINSLNSLNNL